MTPSGTGYNLLRLDPSIDVGPLLSAAERAGVPLAVIDLAPDVANQAYAEKLLLVRPDQHIAWRGQALPDNPKALIARVTGRQASTSQRLSPQCQPDKET